MLTFLQLIFFLILFPLQCIGEKYTLAICAIFQNDAPFLKEWIEFHKLQGVEHFYLYNNSSVDHYLEVLNPYVKKKEVTLTEWPHLHDHADNNLWNQIQCAAYEHCLKNFGTTTKWIAFIDSDEFLFSPSGEQLNKFLRRYKNYGGVGVNWRMFGTSSVYDIPEKNLMIEHLIRCAPYDHHENRHIKSVVQPKYTIGCTNPHFFLYIAKKFAVETDFTPISGPFSSTIKLNKLRINHYWTRTKRYLCEFKIPRRNHMCGEETQGLLERAELLNQEEDGKILQFVSKLRKKMGF